MPTITEGNPTVISLKLQNDDYTVLVGSGLLSSSADLIEQETGIQSRKAAIVTDSTVGPLYAAKVEQTLQSAGIETHLITVPAGEASKSMEQVTEVSRQM
ncbi:MAG: 3-dehydroquinate synthase, partial [Verrucomicrobiota bacterium]